MSSDQEIRLEPLTRDRWIQIVEHSGVEQEIRPRQRQSPRYHVDRMVKVIIHPLIGSRKEPQELSCAVLEISAGGMMLRTRQEMRLYARLTIEWPEGDETFVLSGKVRHCTGTVGAFKVGIELDFPPSKS